MNEEQAKQLNNIAAEIHSNNANWWVDIEAVCAVCGGEGRLYPMLDLALPATCDHCLGTGHPKKERNVGEMLMLCVSELAEAMEGHRKQLPDDKIPHRSMLEVELADCVIRCLDLAAGLGLDLGSALIEKVGYNLQRADHKVEARKGIGGKRY